MSGDPTTPSRAAGQARGRPQASSQEALAEAAAELFFEQGYARTSVADITRRAGVSRSSFFNYFSGKAATLWFTLDEHLAGITKRVDDETLPIHRILAHTAAELGARPPHTLALAIANADVMGVAAELAEERAVRQAALAFELSRALRRGGAAQLTAEIDGAAYAAALFAALWHWAERGAGTHRLEAEVETALSQVPRRPEPAQLQAPPLQVPPLQVSVLGAGAIGGRVIEELRTGGVRGAALAHVITRRDGDLARAMATSDLIVECAGAEAARTLGPDIVASGTDLLLTSVGALAERDTRATLVSGPGRLLTTSGAVGGLDILRAAARTPGGITRARLTSTKRASVLVQPWMSDAEADELRTATARRTIFSGSVADAIARFPASLNVASALAAATGLWDDVIVELVADPAAERTTHRISASGAAGDYEFSITNAVSQANPSSSAVVADAVLREIEDVARWRGTR